MPMVAEVMAEACMAARELDLIAATVAPAASPACASPLPRRAALPCHRRKAFGTDSLTVMAPRRAVGDLSPKGPFAVAVDARRGMIYLGLYDEAGEQREGPLLVSRLTMRVHFASVRASSRGRERRRASCRSRAPARARIEAPSPELQPSAAALAKIALEAARPSYLRPLYLRPPDARPQQPSVARR